MQINTFSTHTDLVMNHSVANVLNPSFFNDFSECIYQIDGSKNLIISGNGRFFSSGLDLFYINSGQFSSRAELKVCAKPS